MILVIHESQQQQQQQQQENQLKHEPNKLVILLLLIIQEVYNIEGKSLTTPLSNDRTNGTTRFTLFSQIEERSTNSNIKLNEATELLVHIQ